MSKYQPICHVARTQKISIFWSFVFWQAVYFGVADSGRVGRWRGGQWKETLYFLSVASTINKIITLIATNQTPNKPQFGLPLNSTCQIQQPNLTQYLIVPQNIKSLWHTSSTIPMASALSTKPFLAGSRTDSLSAFVPLNSDLRSLSSVYLRPRFPKKLRQLSLSLSVTRLIFDSSFMRFFFTAYICLNY